ncbi:MAG TPA: M23 family metallopeptidase [Anaerolineales bacterium]|nr:M23 family metallopeptidase [Anaerolineales bacterium]
MSIEDLQFWWGFGNTTFAQEFACDWYSRTSGMHPGIGFGIAYGTPLYWPADQPGVVVSVDGDPIDYSAGPHSLIIEAGGFRFLFGHMSDQDPTVEVGDTIQPGDLIGYSGNPSGVEDAGNDHLHLEVRPVEDRRIVVNPLAFFAQSQRDSLFDLFSGDYTGDDNPLSSGFYTLQLVDSCFDGE